MPTEDEKAEISMEKKIEQHDTEFGDGKDASPVGGAVLEMVRSVDESQTTTIVPEDVSAIDQSLCPREE